MCGQEDSVDVYSRLHYALWPHGLGIHRAVLVWTPIVVGDAKV